MKTLKISLLAAMLGASSLAFAADMGSDAARAERMNEALDSYRNAQAPAQGPAARAGDSMRRGAHRAGESMKHGEHKARHGAHRMGDKMHGDHKHGPAHGAKHGHPHPAEPKAPQ